MLPNMLLGLSTLGDIKGKRVLVRAPFNVPMDGGTIRDTSRIDDCIPTIDYLINAGARVILVSHHSDGAETSLKPVADHLQKKGLHIRFVEDIASLAPTFQSGPRPEGVGASKAVTLLENLRRYAGEEKNDPAFAQQLASLADIYVNDDFTTAHREHASIVGVPKLLPSVVGLSFQREYEGLSKFASPTSPSLAIIGGAKPETKLPLIAKMVDRFNVVYTGGVSANVLLEDRGEEIGMSQSASKNIPDLDAITADTRIKLPIDARIIGTDGVMRVGPINAVAKDESIVDAGPESLAELRALIAQAQTIIWNGPLGDYERGYGESTHELARMLMDCDGQVVIGGGDTLASIKDIDTTGAFAFVSEAGGAMLHLFAYGTLPAVEALER